MASKIGKLGLLQGRFLYSTQAVLAIGLFAGLLYGFGYSNIKPSYFLNRDDALICYSHAVNLVDYGFSGVNPSGERVEAYSTPLLFLAYWLYYALSHGSFQDYVIIQTVVCTLLLGWFIFRASPVQGWRAVGVAATVGFLLSQHTRWLQWHASGMENALSEVALVATLAAIMRGLQGKPSLWHAIPFALLGIARVEFLFYSGPLLVLYVLLFNKQVNWQRAWASVSAGLLATGVVHLIRIGYYGNFQPNTSWAQGLNLSRQLMFITGHDTWYISKTNVVVADLLYYNGALLGFFALGMVAVLGSETLRRLAVLVMAVMALTVAHGLLFAATRLDPMRYGTQLAPACMLLVAGAAFALTKTSAWVAKGLTVAAIPMAWLFTRTQAAPAGDICCNYETFTPILDSSIAFSNKHQLYRATLANPDLGITSYRKKLNIIDLANIGTSALARSSFANPLKKHYLFYYAAPDLVELHDFWVSAQESFMRDYRFGELYAPRWTFPNGDNPQLPNGFWHRKDILASSSSHERQWLNILLPLIRQKAPTVKVAEAVKNELAKSTTGSPTLGKTYIARTIYRFLPEIRTQEGMVEALIHSLKKSPTYAYDSLLLSSGSVRDYGGKVLEVLSQSLMREVFGTKAPLRFASPLSNYIPKERAIANQHGWTLAYTPGVLVLHTEDLAHAPHSRWIRIRTWLKGQTSYQEGVSEVDIQGTPYQKGQLVVVEIPTEPLDSLEVYSEGKESWTMKPIFK